MDEYSRRATMDDLAQRRTEGDLTYEWATGVLGQYDVLTTMALEVTRVVWALRWPRSGYEPSFEINFGEEYRHDSKLGDQYTRAVSVGFYMHSNNDSFDYPFEYLFMSYAEIQTAEDIRADEEHRKAQAALEKQANEKRSRDIATLKRLREEYPNA